MIEWIRKTRAATSLNDDTDNPINIPEQIYEELELVGGEFNIRVYNDDKRPGMFYLYFARMISWPRTIGKKRLRGKDKEKIKSLSLLYLKEKFTQALREIEELEN